jgi:hypothetical protein
VGKGRDVGLNQISLFEAKVACGNGEQVLCRESIGSVIAFINLFIKFSRMTLILVSVLTNYKVGGSAGGSAGEKRPLPPARGREAGAGRWRSRPARAGGITSLSPALERPPGREAGEREARHWRGESAGESDVARSDWSTCRDLMGPRVLAVATSRF